MSVSISQVSFEHHRQAIGIGEPEPRISWRFGGTASSESQLSPWLDKPLQSGDQAKVRVRAHGQQGEVSTLWSRLLDVEAAFSTGSVATSSARLYVTALGLYEVYINGHRYRHVYHPYDVTDLVSQGDNAIGVIVALLVVRFEDDEEFHDSRLEDSFDEWSEASFHGDLWHSTVQLPSITHNLASPDGPPIRKIEERAPRSIWTSPSGETLVDFGPNIARWLRVRSSWPSSTKITFSHADVLENGELSIEALRTAKAQDILILNGRDSQAFEPHSTTGWSRCSNPLMNQFHQSVRYSMKGKFFPISSDCSQRDERLGWMGDAMSEMRSSGAMLVPHHVPNTAPNRECCGNWPRVVTVIWGDIAVSDLALLKEQYEQSSAWIDSGVVRDSCGLWERSGFQWGDWLDPLSPDSDPGAAITTPHLVADAYLIGMTDLLARMSNRLGENVMAKKYRHESKKLRQPFADVWLRNGSMDWTQTTYSLAICFDLFLRDSDRERAAQTLRDLISENGYLVGAGFAATWILGHALRKIGATEDFYKMLLQTRVPSCLY
ncbi:bacterial alpha-L-rhamnosidase-domain-containing protein [Dactylonectria estremocensis]|uniref:alpha-L-rhamnosidase n=1 Tax=Dactylonectria estremocensis TaxID=1079267 RepID=A0A9P9ISW7_9HYPO|nr:bacterial alpha-L-rhamnosidase-domain-containing protein [Dactylonectria estremocensis]